MENINKYPLIITYLQNKFPFAQTELNYQSPYQLLCAVILSAQCTDKRVNEVTPKLFARYPSVKSLAAAKEDDIFAIIHSISYPNNKAKYLLTMSKQLLERYDGEVPYKIEDLMSLSGVGRKTALVVANVIFNMPTMPVDTHVQRVARRLGLVPLKATVLQIERQLTQNIPQDLLGQAHHWLILFGRQVCKARNPQCQQCNLQSICQYFQLRIKV